MDNQDIFNFIKKNISLEVDAEIIDGDSPDSPDGVYVLVRLLVRNPQTGEYEVIAASQN